MVRSTPPSLLSIMRSRVLGVDPDVVVVAVVRPLDRLEGLAAVDALEQRHLRAPDDVGVLGIDGDGGEVPGPLAQVMAGVDQLPGVAAVVGAEQAALLGLDQGVDAPAVGRGDGDADLAPDAFRQPLARRPCVRSTASCFQVSPPSREMYRPLPGPPLVSSHGPAPRLPQAGEQDAAGWTGRSRRRRRRCPRP